MVIVVAQLVMKFTFLFAGYPNKSVKRNLEIPEHNQVIFDTV